MRLNVCRYVNKDVTVRGWLMVDRCAADSYSVGAMKRSVIVCMWSGVDGVVCYGDVRCCVVVSG